MTVFEEKESSLNSRETAAAKRETDLLERENKQVILENDVKNAEKNVDTVMKCFNTVFRNIEVRKNIFHSETESITGHHHGNNWVSDHSVNHTTNHNETETKE